MEFSTFNTREKAEQGAFCHFRNPVTNDLMYDENKEAIGAMLRGTESKSVTSAVRRAQKRGLTGEAATMNFAASLVISFVGVIRNGELVPADEEGIKWVFDQSSAFEAQIIEFAQDRASFFDKNSKD